MIHRCQVFIPFIIHVMAKLSPTQLSLKLMRERGYLCQVVEHWNPFARIRQDLFGFIDVLCIKEGEVVGVQSTSRSHVSNRYNKIKDHDNVWPVLDSGIRILIQGWAKNKSGRWEMREVEVKAETIPEDEIEDFSPLTDSEESA